jgi:hypothetical protein
VPRAPVEETTDLSQFIDKLYHIMVHLAMSGSRTHNVSGDTLSKRLDGTVMLYKYKDVTYKYIDQIKSCITIILGPLWSLLYDLWIYNYLFNQCVSPLTL